MVVRQSTQVPKTSKRRARSGVERVILMLAIVLDRRERGTGTLENMLCWVGGHDDVNGAIREQRNNNRKQSEWCEPMLGELMGIVRAIYGIKWT